LGDQELRRQLLDVAKPNLGSGLFRTFSHRLRQAWTFPVAL
jgi:hypothetical protein